MTYHNITHHNKSSNIILWHKMTLCMKCHCTSINKCNKWIKIKIAQSTATNTTTTTTSNITMTVTISESTTITNSVTITYAKSQCNINNIITTTNLRKQRLLSGVWMLLILILRRHYHRCHCQLSPLATHLWTRREKRGSDSRGVNKWDEYLKNKGRGRKKLEK